MNRTELESDFRDVVVPSLARHEADGVRDLPMRLQAWNDYVDSLIKEGQPPERAGNWLHPKWLLSKRALRPV